MSREAAVGALETLIASAYAWTTPPSRRLRLWSEVAPEARPIAFLFEGTPESYEWSNSLSAKRTIEVKLFVYINAKDPSVIGAALINGIMEALDAALAPPPGSPFNTLGGNCQRCFISGTPIKDPGDLDGDGLLIAPVKIILP